MSTSIKYVLISIAAIVLVSCGEQEHVQKWEVSGASIYRRPEVLIECDSAVAAYGQYAAQSFDFNDAREIYLEYIRDNPNVTELHRALQDFYFRYNRQHDLVDDYRAAYEADSSSAMNAYLYGRTSTDNEVQEYYFRKATELDSNYFWGWYALATCLVQEPFFDTADAIEAHKKAISLDNSQPMPFNFLSNIYRSRGELDSALAYADLLSKTQPDEIGSLKSKLDLLCDVGRCTEAERLAGQFVNRHSDDGEAVRALIKIDVKQGNYEVAKRHMYQLLKLARDKDDVIHMLLVNFCRLGQSDSAFALLNYAIDNGFSDYRPLLYDPDLKPLRDHRKFEQMRIAITAGIDSTEAARKAILAETSEERKRAVLIAKLNEPAPDFTLTDLYGEKVTLSELRGSVVILDFWATWCKPCKSTLPMIQKFYDERKDDMIYYSVNVWQPDTSEVRPYLSKYGYTFDLLFGNNKTTYDFKITGIPKIVIVDEDGIIRYVHERLRPDLDEALSWQLDDLLSD
jgi:thiol-disulfide isomerase/thioredoxin/tetratricopeptide (TPR) repeat protein